MDNFCQKRRAFTLLEVLVVVVIIGFLVTLAIVALSSSRMKARDTKRISDVKSLQTALELYYTDESNYPPTSSVVPGLPLVGLITGHIYMTKVPSAPYPRIEGACANDADYTYNQTQYNSYTLNYCLAATVGAVSAGLQTAVPGDIALARVTSTPAVTPSAVLTITAIGVEGSYSRGNTLAAAHRLAVTVNVSQAGSYSLSTAVVNGYSFSVTSTVAAGVQIVYVPGSGTPIAAGLNSFTLSGNGGSRSFTVAPTTLTAVLSIDSVQVNGQYVTGVALYNASADYHLTVTRAGNYSFAATPSPNNGYSFAARSGFIGLGSMIINSTGSGTPISAGTDSFTVSGNSTSKGFTVTAIGPPSITYNGVTYQYLPDQVTTSFDNAKTACDSLVSSGYSDWVYTFDMGLECYIRTNGLAQRFNYHWDAEARSKWPCTPNGALNPVTAGYRCVRIP